MKSHVFSGERREESAVRDRPGSPDMGIFPPGGDCGFLGSYPLDDGPVTIELPEGSYWWRINRKRLKVYREDVCLGENTCDDMKRVPKGSRKVTITPYHRMYTSYYEYRWE